MKILLILGLVILQLNGFGQSATSQGDVTGTVHTIDEAVAGASIQLKTIAGKLIQKKVSDSSGHFNFSEVEAGNYQLLVSTIGFSSSQKNIVVNPASITIQDMLLTVVTKELAAVTVLAQKKAIEYRADKTIINVDASPTNAGANALEVLEKSPGVLVDHNGTISLAGKAGVNVLIDGKRTQMSAGDLANYLRSLPASQLDQVELITQPSAKYEAEGNAGIINLKFKKNKIKGLNGSLGSSYTQGIYGRTTSNVSIGYRTGKWNLYANGSGTQQIGFNDINLVRSFRKKVTQELSSVFNQQTDLKYKGFGSNLSVDADYLLSQKTTIGLKIKNSSNDLNFDVPTDMKIYNAQSQYIGNTKTSGTNKLDNKNFTISANIKIDIDSQGRQFTADADYARFFSNSNQALYNYFYDANGDEQNNPYLLRGTNPSLYHIYSAKADYVHPFNNKSKLEAGIKSSFVTSDNDAAFQNKNSGNWETDTRSNNFIYKENINAAYVNGSSKWEKLELQVGLRLENTTAEGDQRTTNQKFDRNYTKLFPTVFASYKLNNVTSVNANFGRRITRPDYDALNPFQMLLNPYTYQQGNPMLQPQFSDNAELGYIHKNGLYSAKLSYADVKDIIVDVLTQDEATTVSYVQPENLARQQNLQLQLSTNATIAKWWTINANLTGSYLHFKGLLSGYQHEINYKTFDFNINNQLKFKKGFSAEISGTYRHNNLFSGNSIIKRNGMLNAGFSKQVLHKKGTFKLNFRDILGTNKFEIVQQYHEFESYFTNRFDSRSVTLGFTWRFAKNEKNVLQQRNKGASNDEQERTGKN